MQKTILKDQKSKLRSCHKMEQKKKTAVFQMTAERNLYIDTLFAKKKKKHLNIN